MHMMSKRMGGTTIQIQVNHGTTTTQERWIPNMGRCDHEGIVEISENKIVDKKQKHIKSQGTTTQNRT